MLGVYGLHGHIRHNAMKSASLMSGFVVLICLSWYAWCIVYTAIAQVWWPHLLKGRRYHRQHNDFDFAQVLDIFDKALDTALFRWWVPLLLSAMWFLVAFLVHADMIRMATGARPVTRKEEPKLYNMVETSRDYRRVADAARGDHAFWCTQCLCQRAWAGRCGHRRLARAPARVER